jgi:hypothetical protein
MLHRRLYFRPYHPPFLFKEKGIWVMLLLMICIYLAAMLFAMFPGWTEARMADPPDSSEE